MAAVLCFASLQLWFFGYICGVFHLLCHMIRRHAWSTPHLWFCSIIIPHCHGHLPSLPALLPVSLKVQYDSTSSGGFWWITFLTLGQSSLSQARCWRNLVIALVFVIWCLNVYTTIWFVSGVLTHNYGILVACCSFRWVLDGWQQSPGVTLPKTNTCWWRRTGQSRPISFVT